jgi:hypothetical protein
VAVLVELLLAQVHLELPIQVAVVVVNLMATQLLEQAVAVSSSSATPATFNISLVVQYLPVTVMLSILLHRQAH